MPLLKSNQASTGLSDYDLRPAEVPVLLMVYRRPELTKKIITRLRELGVQNLFVSFDAPANPDEIRLVAEVKKVVESGVDWECSLSTNYRETNEGLRLAVVSAIDWFFSHVSEGIILEDDCLPSEDFFRFCAEGLTLYRDDERVFHIAGDNTADVSIEQAWSYCFVRYPHIWGWATWRRAWAKYDRDLAMWEAFSREGMVESLFPLDAERRVWEPIYNRLSRKGIPDTWDFQWSATVAMNDGLSVQTIPNLVSNLGFGDGATHTKKPGRRSNRSAQSLGKIVHPPVVYRHAHAESQIFHNTHLGVAIPSFKRIVRKRVRRASAWIMSVFRFRVRQLRGLVSFETRIK